MGFILSKFRKTKISVKDTLDKIEKDLGKLARFQIDTELQQKRIIGKLFLGASVLYIVSLVFIYYFGLFNDLPWQQKIGWAAPLVLFPFIIIAIKRILAWYFERKIVNNKKKYEDLKKEKQRLLDDVMENETFKVAKEILEKYAPSQLLPKYLAEQSRNSPGGLTPLPRTGIRRRTTHSMTSTPVPYSGMGGFTPRAIRPYGPGPGQFLRQPTNNFRPAIMPPPGSGGPVLFPGGPPPPRFMLPPPPSNPLYRTRKTGWLDKVVDYVVGDGPSNRFALICRYCATHNGLATPDDFPYIGYRCVYCRQFNPPRQQRPSAAILPKNTVLIEEMDSTAKSTDNSVNDEGSKDESRENVENSNTENRETAEKSEEPDTKQNDDEEPIIELAASSVEDLRTSTESLTAGEEQSEVDSENDDQASLADDPANTTIPAQEDDDQKVSSGTSETPENETLENPKDSK